MDQLSMAAVVREDFKPSSTSLSVRYVERVAILFKNVIIDLIFPLQELTLHNRARATCQPTITLLVMPPIVE